MDLVKSIFISYIAAYFLNFISHIFINYFEEKKLSDYPKKNFFPLTSSIFFLNEKVRKSINLYILCEILTIALSILSIISFKDNMLMMSLSITFTYSLITLTIIDIKTQYLPDIITIPLIVLGLIQSYFGIFSDIEQSLYGAITGFLMLWGINYTFKLIKKQDGMGFGDFKLMAAICAWTGVKFIPLIILISSTTGIITAIIFAKLSGRNLYGTPSPFGPSLALAGIVSLIFGEDIIAWYLNMLSI